MGPSVTDSLDHSLAHSLTHSLTHPLTLTHLLAHSLTHSLTHFHLSLHEKYGALDTACLVAWIWRSRARVMVRVSEYDGYGECGCVASEGECVAGEGEGALDTACLVAWMINA